MKKQFYQLFLTVILLTCSVTVFAQTKTVTGNIVDNNGAPVIGATILIVGTTNGTTTDVDGNFSLGHVSADNVLQISYIGYVTQTIPVGAQTNIRIVLVEDTQALDELYEGIHHAGIQADRIMWHQQMGSTLQNHWPVSDNVNGTQGQTGNGKGAFRPFNTFKPFPQAFMDMLTDENGNLLDETAKAAYQNPGYN